MWILFLWKPIIRSFSFLSNYTYIKIAPPTAVTWWSFHIFHRGNYRQRFSVLSSFSNVKVDEESLLFTWTEWSYFRSTIPLLETLRTGGQVLRIPFVIIEWSWSEKTNNLFAYTYVNYKKIFASTLWDDFYHAFDVCAMRKLQENLCVNFLGRFLCLLRMCHA